MATEVTRRTRLERFTDYLWRNQREKFRLGVHDCGLFVCRWVDGELDTDYERRVRTIVARDGLARVRAFLRDAGAYRALVTSMAQRAPSTEPEWDAGAVCVFAQPDGTETLGLLSKRLVYCPGSEGLVAFGTDRVLCHWSLECLRQ